MLEEKDIQVEESIIDDNVRISAKACYQLSVEYSGAVYYIKPPEIREELKKVVVKDLLHEVNWAEEEIRKLVSLFDSVSLPGIEMNNLARPRIAMWRKKLNIKEPRNYE